LGELSDAAIVTQVLSGNREAFAELIDRNRRLVFSVHLNSVGDRDMAEDLTQETFIKAYRALETYDASAGRFSTWLTTIAVRIGIDARRRQKPTESLEHLHEDKGFDPASDARTERSTEAAGVGDAVRRALRRLPDQQRLAVTLKHIEDLPFSEVARIMGCSVNSAKVHAHRGRLQLARFLGYMREEGLA